MSHIKFPDPILIRIGKIPPTSFRHKICVPKEDDKLLVWADVTEKGYILYVRQATLIGLLDSVANDRCDLWNASIAYELLRSNSYLEDVGKWVNVALKCGIEHSTTLGVNPDWITKQDGIYNPNTAISNLRGYLLRRLCREGYIILYNKKLNTHADCIEYHATKVYGYFSYESHTIVMDYLIVT